MDVKDKIADYILLNLGHVYCDMCISSPAKCIICQQYSEWALSEKKAYEIAEHIIEIVSEVDNE